MNINTGYTSGQSILSYLDTRLNGASSSTESADTTTADSNDGVSISLSPEAVKALAAIEKSTEAYAAVTKALGSVDLDAASEMALAKLGRELDSLLGTNVKTTSESYLLLGDKREEANTLISEIVDLFSQEDLSQADKTVLSQKVAELDTLLSSGSAYASHEISTLSEDQQKEVINMFMSLMNQTKGLENNALSTSEVQLAGQTSTSIDAFFEENGTVRDAKELSASDQAKVNSILNQIDNIMKDAGGESISHQLQAMQESQFSAFIDILSGKTSNTQSDPLSEFMNNRYGNNSVMDSSGNVQLSALNAYTRY